MMTLEQAETAIFQKVSEFAKAENIVVVKENQQTADGKPFTAPTNKPWCRVAVQYADSYVAGMATGVCIRDQGIISILCFTPKNKGSLDMTRMCEKWRALFQSFNVDHLEIYMVHAPMSMDDDDFYAKIVRAEFRVN